MVSCRQHRTVPEVTRERGLRALLWIIPVSSSFKSMGAATLGFELYKTKQEFAAQTEALVR